MKITNPITLDVARSNSYICLLGKQFDSNSRFLEVSLTNNGQALTIPAGAAVVLRATRADGTGAVVSGTVADGKATVELDDYILEVAGAASLSIEISKDGEILTTASCNLTVQKADATGWIRVYIADASKAAGNYYITIGGTSYSFTTTQTIPAGGAVYFGSEGGTAQTRDASGNVLDASLPVSIASTGTELTSDVPTMSFLTAIAGRMATIEAEMPQKANIDGSYPLLHAGTADNLMTDNGATQAIPFIQEGTGKGNGEATVKAGGVLQLKKKLGNTVCVNQLVQNWDFSDGTTGWMASGATLSAANNELTATATSNATPNLLKEIKITDGHKYLVRFAVYPQETMTAIAFFLDYEGSVSFRVENIAGGSWKYISQIVTASASKTAQMTTYFNYNNANNGKVTKFKEFPVSDLTLWFGSNDRIPSDLLAHPENWGRYYAGALDNNAGTLESADGSILTSIHRNIWDEEWEVGVYNNNTGEKAYASGYIRSKNKISVIPNTQYYTNVKLWLMFYDASGAYISYLAKSAPGYFTVPANCHQLAFNVYDDYGGTYKNDITISLYYPGEPGYDQYYPFSVLASVDTGNEVLRSAGSVADEKLPSGVITRKVIDIDLGTFNYYGATADGRTYSYGLTGIQTPSAFNVEANVRSAKYIALTQQIWYAATTPGITITGNGYGTPGQIGIVDSALANMDSAQIQAALSGIHVYAELATPTTEQGTTFAENIPCDDFGSMYWTQTKGIPQGNEIFYPDDLKGTLESIVAALPSANGTYTFHATVTTAGVTFSWS